MGLLDWVEEMPKPSLYRKVMLGIGDALEATERVMAKVRMWFHREGTGWY